MSAPMDRVSEALRASGRPVRWREDRTGGYARCPAHEDKRPSLSIREGRDGRILLHCFAGCSSGEVVAALGLTWGDLFAEERDRPASARPPRRRRRMRPGPAPHPSVRWDPGAPNLDALFWRQPEEAIAAHFDALPPGPSDADVAAHLARKRQLDDYSRKGMLLRLDALISEIETEVWGA